MKSTLDDPIIRVYILWEVTRNGLTNISLQQSNSSKWPQPHNGTVGWYLLDGSGGNDLDVISILWFIEKWSFDFNQTNYLFENNFFLKKKSAKAFLGSCWRIDLFNPKWKCPNQSQMLNINYEVHTSHRQTNLFALSQRMGRLHIDSLVSLTILLL